jgi:CheY-like chemotaxis protein
MQQHSVVYRDRLRVSCCWKYRIRIAWLMKKILLVDDDKVVRSFLARVLKQFADEFEIILATTGKEAVQILQNDRVDLIVTDLQMPEMNGYEFLTFMSENNPGIPVFVMTANGSKSAEERSKSLGSKKYFEKPMNVEVFTQSILEELECGVEGLLEGISLASFLQLVELETKTCTIEVTYKNKSGKLYCQNGGLLSAETADLKNDQAAYEMISWEKCNLKIDNICRKTAKEIKQPLMNILMEGTKIRDDRESKSKKKVPLKPLHDLKPKNR